MEKFMIKNYEQEFKEKFAEKFPHIDMSFVELMNDIGQHGVEKYKDESIVNKIKSGSTSRTPRTRPRTIGQHASDHFLAYVNNIPHDYFHTKKHQLAASAFNVMMEYQLFIAEAKRELLSKDDLNNRNSKFFKELKKYTPMNFTFGNVGDYDSNCETDL